MGGDHVGLRSLTQWGKHVCPHDYVCVVMYACTYLCRLKKEKSLWSPSSLLEWILQLGVEAWLEVTELVCALARNISLPRVVGLGGNSGLAIQLPTWQVLILGDREKKHGSMDVFGKVVEEARRAKALQSFPCLLRHSPFSHPGKGQGLFLLGQRISSERNKPTE